MANLGGLQAGASKSSASTGMRSPCEDMAAGKQNVGHPHLNVIQTKALEKVRDASASFLSANAAEQDEDCMFFGSRVGFFARVTSD